MATRRWFTGTLVVILLVASAAVFVWQPWAASETAATATEQPPVAPPKTATVRTGDLVAEQEFDGSVGYGESWKVGTALTGTVTSYPAVGTIVQPGAELARVADRPLTLVDGAMPIYRELLLVNTRERDENNNRKTLQTGPDVEQLQRFLMATGHTDEGRLQIDGEFGQVTEQAVEEWQESVGLPVSGKVDGTQIVFHPGGLRVAETIRVGADFSGVSVTTPTPRVTVDTSNRERGALAEQTEVLVEIGEGDPIAGTVSTQESVAGEDGGTIARSTIDLQGDVPGDEGRATVTTTEILAQNATLVPASALLALAEGGYAVERIGDGRSNGLIPVELTEVSDATAAVVGELTEGDEVVIAE